MKSTTSSSQGSLDSRLCHACLSKVNLRAFSSGVLLNRRNLSERLYVYINDQVRDSPEVSVGKIDLEAKHRAQNQLVQQLWRASEIQYGPVQLRCNGCKHGASNPGVRNSHLGTCIYVSMIMIELCKTSPAQLRDVI